MTTSTIPAGPDLDRMVAEEVMGWTYEPEFGLMESERFREIDGPWSPSTNIAHAWEVMAHMATCQHPDRPALWWNTTAGGYVCVPGFDMTLARIMHDRPRDMPLAICRAALACVRGEA